MSEFFHSSRPEALNLPELERHWVAWNSELRDGKPTKVPKNPRTGGNAMSKTPSTWGTYEQAVTTAKRHGFAGVGFQVEGTDIFGVDFDWKGLDSEEIPLCVQTILDTMPDSYIEYSPSRRGIHVYARGHLPDKAISNRKIQLENGIWMEVYDSGRYFSVTGWVINPVPLVDLTEFFANFKLIFKEIPAPQPHREYAGLQKGTSRLESECNKIRAAQVGSRNTVFNTVVYTVGGIVGSGEVEESEALRCLTDAALSIGLGQEEIDQVLYRVIKEGIARPFAPRKVREQVKSASIEEWCARGTREKLDRALESFGKATSASPRTNVAFKVLVDAIVRLAQDPTRVYWRKEGMVVRIGGVVGLARMMQRGGNQNALRGQLNHLATLGFTRGLIEFEAGKLEKAILLSHDFWDSAFFRESLQITLPLSVESVRRMEQARQAREDCTIRLVNTPSLQGLEHSADSPLKTLRRCVDLVHTFTSAPRTMEELIRLTPFTLRTLHAHVADLERGGFIEQRDGVFVQTKNLRSEFNAIHAAHEPTRRAERRSLENYAKILSFKAIHRDEAQRQRREKSVINRLERLDAGECLTRLYPLPSALTRAAA